MENQWLPTIRLCNNCGRKITGNRNKDGLLKIKCPFCFTSMVSKVISRRHERIDVYAPLDEVIDN